MPTKNNSEKTVNFKTIFQGSFKVADFHIRTFPESLMSKIKIYGLVYSDCVLEEDIYSVSNISEHEDFPKFLTKTERKQFDKLSRFMNKNDFSYIRFIS
jgi:hypothetical protein